MRVSPHLLPLCTLRRTPPPISLLSRFKTLCVLLRAFKACFLIPACKCNRAEVCRCTFGLYAESPRSARLSRSNGNNLLKSNPFGHDKAPRWKPWVTESFAGNVLKKGGLRSYTYFDFWWQFPQKILLPWFSWCQPSEPLKTTCQGGFFVSGQEITPDLQGSSITSWTIADIKIRFTVIKQSPESFLDRAETKKPPLGGFFAKKRD